MKRLIGIIIAGIITICMMTPITAQADATTNEYIIDVFNLVNEARVAEGASKLNFNSDLNYLANVRAEETIDVWDHIRPDGTKYSTIFTEYNITTMTSGENIAYGSTTPEGVMNLWMNSAGHRTNILNSNYTDIGIGCVRDTNGTYYWVQIFAKNPDTSNSLVPEQILGDINNDGSITVADIILIAKYIVGSPTDYSVTVENADINGDNVVNVIDLVLMAQSLV